MSFQVIRCAYCQAEFDDLVVATHHSRACDDSPNAKLIRAVKALKEHPCVTDTCHHAWYEGVCGFELAKAVKALP